MTAERTDGVADSAPTRASPSDRRFTFAGVLRTVARRLRRDPVLAVPFTAVGALLAAADFLRGIDPIPAATGAPAAGINVEYSIFPRGVGRTGRTLGAVVDLDLPYFLWAVGLEALLVAAVSLAGFATIAWTLGARVRDRPVALLRYVAVLAALSVAYQALGRTQFEPHGMLVALIAMFVLLQVLVRVAMTPAFLVAGRGATRAVWASVAASRGIGWTLFGLVVALGIAASVLARAPVVGPYLSTAIVATVHSVALGVVYRHCDPANGGGSSRTLEEP